MTEPIHAILRHSVDVWTSDPVALGFHNILMLCPSIPKFPSRPTPFNATQPANKWRWFNA